jgi:antitoxin component YwqK of YwqJK toxin-antitoxin module
MGYGVVMDVKDPGRVIRTILEGSPAAKAGIKAKDVILSINGTSTTGMDNQAIVTLLKKQEQANLEIERGGTKLTISISKAPLYTFDRKCLSGDCVNGAGRAIFLPDNGVEYETTFSNGDIVGECKIYRKGVLLYEGGVKNRQRHGAGKAYMETDDHRVVLLKEGTFTTNVLTKGTTYNEDGSVNSYGNYDKEGRLTEGFFQYSYRDSNNWYVCADIRYDANERHVLNGPAKIYQRDKSGKLQLIVEGTYRNGKRDGLVKEWDYTEGARHEITYNHGIASGGTIYRISDNTVIGRDVKYRSGFPERMGIDCIYSGKFNFGNGEKTIALKEGEFSWLTGIRKMSTETKQPETNPQANTNTTTTTTPTTTTTTNTNTNTTTTSQPSKERLEQFKRERAEYNFTRTVRAVSAKMEQATDYIKSATPQNFDHSREMFLYYKKSMISEINKTLYDWEDEFPAYYTSKLKEIRNTIQNTYFPMKPAPQEQ